MIFFTPRESYLWLRAIWEHHRNLKMTRAELEAAQLRKFRRLVGRVRERSPYYRKIIQDRGIDPLTCTPTDFPVLTKADVARHFDDLVTDRGLTRERITAFLSRSTDPQELMDGRYHVLHTSGTSGTVGCYVFSKEAWIRGASQATRMSPLRWRRRVAFVAATRGHFAGASLMLTGNSGSNQFFYNMRTFDVGRPLSSIVQELNAFQPRNLSGYATVLKQLAEAQERGELRIRPEHVGNGGEPLLPDVKAYLERVFGVPVMNAYATSEHLYMGLTFPGSNVMHLLEDDLIFELHEDHTCVTNLFNDALPLIRYRMDDVLVPVTEGANPLPFTQVKALVGRQENALTFLNAQGKMDFIHPIVIVEIMVPGLNAWQVVLTSSTSFVVRAVLDGALSLEQRKGALDRTRLKFRSLLDEKEMGNVTFEIEERQALEIDPRSGKFQLVLNAT